MGISAEKILKISGIYLTLFLLMIIIAGAVGMKISRIYANEAVDYIKVTNQNFYRELVENASKENISPEEYYYRLLLSRVSKSNNIILVGLGMLRRSKLYLKNTPNLDLSRAILVSLGIMAGSFCIALLIGTFLGLKFLRSKAIGVMARFFTGVPSWWVGVVLILIFVTKLKILSISDIAISAPSLTRYVLPVTTLVLIYVWEIANFVSYEAPKELTMPYTLADRAKGLPERIVRKHVLRNIAITLSSFSFQKFGELFTDFVAIDVLFGLGGLGSLLKQSFVREIVPPYGVIVRFNYHLFFVVTLTIMTILFLISILLETIRGILDPRVS
ncbi:ABC transporter permease subunit [Pyrococcus yayanosii]|uniref:ABC-type dipeptide/oligopeptide transport system, permease protein n=1 Tax=Pyrococcus yayanosii (strain CH1 / JCM 16557) TaxID=529709 RepID=F8AIP6_PYRYC|nr:ABC transporter permease subunit [Pyrococcus yayanosii]AEH23812.1 ABC-type dipeptide/oligopeptide transport system, permease protein [Pyrococcus yayanosii CH1]